MSGDHATAYRLSAALAVLLFVAAVGGLFIPGLYRDAPAWAAQARGVNLVDLFFALPALVASMVLSARDSIRARVVWFGVVGYILYNAVIFAFDIAFNALFLVYVGILSLALFSLMALLTHLDAEGIRTRFSAGTPIRATAVYLVILAALFFLAWMKDIVPAIVGNTTPATIIQARIPSNPVYVLDLALLLPLYIVAAIWLLRRRAWGYFLGGLLLVLNSLLSLSIVSSTIFQYADDRSTSLEVVPMFGVVALVSIGLAVRYFQSLCET